jgi:hypothetical protein
MRGEKRMGAFLLLESRDPFVQGAADQSADPINGRRDVRDEGVGAYAH